MPLNNFLLKVLRPDFTHQLVTSKKILINGDFNNQYLLNVSYIFHPVLPSSGLIVLSQTEK